MRKSERRSQGGTQWAQIGPEKQGPPPAVEGEIRALDRGLLDGWKARSAVAMATLFAEEGNLIGFDGSQLNGRAEIEAHLRQVFGDHRSASYVGKIRGTRFLTPEVAVLRAVAGTVPPGQSDINPAVNAIQTVVAEKCQGAWRIALYQSTPAQLHGRLDLAQALTEELRELL